MGGKVKFEDSLKARLNIVNPTIRDVSTPQNSYAYTSPSFKNSFVCFMWFRKYKVIDIKQVLTVEQKAIYLIFFLNFALYFIFQIKSFNEEHAMRKYLTPRVE
jgi:hypothetical protein